MNLPSLQTIRVAARCLAGILLIDGRAMAANPANKLILQVEQKVHEALPSRAEKRFDEIGWARDIRDAERLAKQSRRPILLFTHDGNISTARC